MGTTRLFQRSLLVLGLAALMAGYGLAAERAPATDTSTLGDANAAAPPTACGDLVRASRVMHSRIEGSDGKILGTVHDIVLAPDLKSVSYIVLSRGGVLGIGNSLYAIPWTAVRQNVSGIFTVPITEAQLMQSRGFRPGHWPTGATLQGAVYQDEMASENKSIQQRRFSHIKGMNAKGSDGVKAGDVRDLAIVMDTGQVAYTILSTGGILGLGSRYAAVPENAITFEPALRVARVDATKATVQANSFMPSRWPDLASPAYSEQVARLYGVAPVGTALAFVPPEGTTAVARAPRTTAPSARSTTPPATTTPTPMGEPTTAELTGTFNPSNITTIDGMVVAEGRFQPTSGSEMLWLRVRPETGQPVLVNLGPRNYISAQDFYVVPGDRIHLTGSQVAATAAGKQVFLPTEVTYESHTLRLRSATGAPLWEGQTGTTAAPPLGFAPAEERATAPGRSATPPSAATPAEPTAEELTGTFNASAITSIDGTVIDEGKFRAPAANQDMLWLRVRTTDGRALLVNLGPRDYVSQQNFCIVRGDQIHLKGSEVATKAAGQRVFLPTEVMYNSHTLRLRSATGAPLWEGQGAGAAATPPLGYTPAESQATAGTGTAAGQTATQFTPAQIINATALDLSTSRTIEGTVIEVGKSGTSTPAAGAASSSQAASSGAEVIWLRVRTTEGQIFNVQLGPRDYLSRQNFFVVNGDRVRLTGWNARSTAAAGATTVFVPADITVNGQTVQLRNRDGEPLWTARAGMAGQMPGMQMPSEQTTPPGTAGSTSRAARTRGTEPNEPNKP